MNQTIASGLSRKLKAMYRDSPIAKRLFDNLEGRQKDVRQTTVERAAQLTSSSAYELRQLFNELETAGAGELKLGRKGAKTRFVWAYGVRSLGAAAKGEVDLPIEIDETEAEDVDELDEDESDVSAPEEIEHEFVLRPGKKVIVRLPSDLTEREAERLSKFVVSLPFHEEGGW